MMLIHDAALTCPVCEITFRGATGADSVSLLNEHYTKMHDLHSDEATADKFRHSSGATSSHCPDFTQIPLEVLIGMAERFQLGQTKHGRHNWRKGLAGGFNSPLPMSEAASYAIERLNHVIKHCYLLAQQIEGLDSHSINEDTPQGNVGALAWGAAFLSTAVERLFTLQSTEKGVIGVEYPAKATSIPAHSPQNPISQRSNDAETPDGPSLPLSCARCGRGFSSATLLRDHVVENH